MSDNSRKRYLLALFACEERRALSVTSLAKELGIQKSMASQILRLFSQKGWLLGRDVRHLSLSQKSREDACLLQIRKSAIKDKLLNVQKWDEALLEKVAAFLLTSPLEKELL
jgi:DNA-binding MarR family transcriptional regulator